eukprot:Plantae.Rhodophyta-Purpureofilum_apyrenoidigerum.ctg777.p1 GENE.Plantae.Rhodophyta-Purpureofilum_apyrenoidigerum.ctg777~~Plantae.Rhodophyta-Purpureofilum_apyrenoidigerum.ctg777.p1  ORF type:complete len:374 (-),score=20.61 Plantae.Rhodophyta-Purpureofilum_apyrenoidigerum.ctg777:122-1243(-)
MEKCRQRCLSFIGAGTVGTGGHGRRSRRAEATLSSTDVDASPAMPIAVLSDLHVDHPTNRQFVMELASERRNEALVVAGDVTHDLDKLEETLRALAYSFRRVLFVCGNHELWVNSSLPGDKKDVVSSLEKLDNVLDICDRAGVLHQNHRIGSVLTVPMPAWYDLSLELPVDPTLFTKFDKWRWSDFSRCNWPTELETEYSCYKGRYPSKVASYFAQRNRSALDSAIRVLHSGAARTALTYSHFLPGAFALPDWLEPDQDIFVPDWIKHDSASVAAKFSRVAGSTTIEDGLRRLTPWVVDHIHCFGHSHRPKDIIRRGVRYVHHPLGSPREREMYLAPHSPQPKLLIDHNGVPVPSKAVTRYWDDCLRGRDPFG